MREEISFSPFIIAWTFSPVKGIAGEKTGHSRGRTQRKGDGTMSEKKNNKPCNKNSQGSQSQQSKGRKSSTISDKGSLLGNAGNTNNGGQAGT